MSSDTVIEIDYEPRNWALKLHDSVVRWIVLVIHRRGGKTTAAMNHLQKSALENPNTRYAYVAPTFKQAKRIVWGMAKHYARDIPGVVFNESELLIKYRNGSEIMIVGSDNPDSLRGIALWGAFLDEYPLQSPIVFTQIITKCLADHLGYCIFGGTPKGKGHFYRVYQVAFANEKGDWCLVYKTIEDSLKEEAGDTVDNLRQALEDDRDLVKAGLMTEDEFQQEWFNSFEAAIKGAVYLEQLSAARKDQRIMEVPYDDRALVHTVWDLGIGDAMAIGFYQHVGNKIHKIDYYENTGLGLKHYIKYVKDKPYIYGKHFAPHDISQKELSTGKTRLESARLLGLEFEVVPMIPVADGIDMARSMFGRCYFDKKKCELWLDLIGQYAYEMDEKRGVFKKEPIHNFASHAADEFRYAAIVEEYMTNEDGTAWKAPVREVIPDEYVGEQDFEEEVRDGMGKHPMMRDVNIGMLGSKRRGE